MGGGDREGLVGQFKLPLLKIRHRFHKTFGEQLVDISASVVKRKYLGVCCKINEMHNIVAYVNLTVVSSQIM